MFLLDERLHGCRSVARWSKSAWIFRPWVRSVSAASLAFGALNCPFEAKDAARRPNDNEIASRSMVHGILLLAPFGSLATVLRIICAMLSA
jgi:hypothetical protein